MSQDELIDIIDEDNKVLYSITKREAHEKGLLHACIVAEVIRSNGDFVLTKQASDRQDAGQYVSPIGGHVESGESDEDALKREAYEELGLKDFRYKLVGRIIYNREVLGRKENHYLVVFEIYTDEKISFNHEVESCKQFTKDKLRKLFRNSPKHVGDAGHVVFNKFYKVLI